MTAVAAWLLLGLLPGLALVVAARPELVRCPVLLVAVGPALSVALGYLTTMLGSVVGFGSWPAVVLADAAVLVAAVVRILLSRRRLTRAVEPGSAHPGRGGGTGAAVPELGSGPEPDRDRSADRWVPVGLLIAAVLVGGVLWSLPPGPVMPLNRDVQNHGYFVARIADENSVDPRMVLTEGPTTEQAVVAFYPLGTHATMAVAHRGADVPIRSLLTVWTMMSAVVVMPCGLFSLARRVARDRPMVAGFAAFTSACLAALAYQPRSWGGVAFTVGMAAVPGTTALVLDAVDRPRASLMLLAAAAVAGVGSIHSSALATLSVLLGTLAVRDLVAATGRQERLAAARSWLAVGGLSGALVLPSVASLLNGAEERTGFAETLSEPVLSAIGMAVALAGEKGPAQPAMGLLAVLGVVVLLAGRRIHPLGRFGGLLAALALFVALFLIATAGLSSSPLRSLTLPWYQSSWRLLYNIALLVPLFAALTLEAVREVLARRSELWPPVLVGALALAVLIIGLPTSLRTLGVPDDRGADFGPEEIALFRLAAERAGEDGVVLNQENDGTAWMYAAAGAPAFTAMNGSRDDPDAADRRYLTEGIHRVGEDPRIRELVSRWGIRDVMVTNRAYCNEPLAFDRRDLEAAGFTLVDSAGQFWLFEVPTRPSGSGEELGTAVASAGPIKRARSSPGELC